MIRSCLAALSLIAALLCPAAAQERVTVATMRSVANGALFLGAARGYFKAEGLDIEMTAYASDRDVVEALATGATDFGVAGFTAAAFNLAGKGTIKAIAAQVREKRDYDGNELIASNAAYAKGLRKPQNLANASFATVELGNAMHYQLGEAARVKGFKLDSVTLKPQGSVAAASAAIADGAADAAILPGPDARDLLTANQAKLVAWASELAETQLGALFASATAIESRRAVVEKFLRAYRRAAADYYAAFLHHDKYGKRVSDAKSLAAAGAIARYVYPGRATGAVAVEAEIYFMDPQARLDGDDVARQVEWYQAQGLVDKSIDARTVMDLSFN